MTFISPHPCLTSATHLSGLCCSSSQEECRSSFTLGSSLVFIQEQVTYFSKAVAFLVTLTCHRSLEDIGVIASECLKVRCLPIAALSSHPQDSTYRWIIAASRNLSGSGSLMGNDHPKDPSYTWVLSGSNKGTIPHPHICLQKGKGNLPWACALFPFHSLWDYTYRVGWK